MSMMPFGSSAIFTHARADNSGQVSIAVKPDLIAVRSGRGDCVPYSVGQSPRPVRRARAEFPGHGQVVADQPGREVIVQSGAVIAEHRL